MPHEGLARTDEEQHGLVDDMQTERGHVEHADQQEPAEDDLDSQSVLGDAGALAGGLHHLEE